MGDLSMNTNEMNEKNQVWKMENVGEGKMKLTLTLTDEPVEYGQCEETPLKWNYKNYWMFAI